MQNLYIETWYFSTHKKLSKMNLIFDHEQRIMPEAVCDIHESGVERNVLGRLLTLTFIYFCKEFQMTGYLRGEVRLPKNLFPTARPRVSIAVNIYSKLILIFIFTHANTTRFTHMRSPPGRWRSRLAPQTRLQSDGRNITTLQHTTKILGVSGGCESRLLKNTKERSSSTHCCQVVNNLTCATRLISLSAAWRR